MLDIKFHIKYLNEDDLVPLGYIEVDCRNEDDTPYEGMVCVKVSSNYVPELSFGAATHPRQAKIYEAQLSEELKQAAKSAANQINKLIPQLTKTKERNIDSKPNS